MFDPQFIMFSGDTHGVTDHVRDEIDICAMSGANTLFVVGDFGYWENTHNNVKFLDKVSSYADGQGVWVFFLDGNHENHPKLWEKYTDETPQGFKVIRDRIFYAPRGHSWTWHGRKFMSCGGSYSVDRALRTEGFSWFPTEMIRDEDVAKCLEVGKVDILLAHDVHGMGDIMGQMMIRLGRNLMPIPDSQDQRDKLTVITQSAQPDVYIHGHYHMRYNERTPVPWREDPMLTMGLSCSGEETDTYIFCDLEEMVFYS